VRCFLIDEYVKKPSAHGMNTFNGSSVCNGIYSPEALSHHTCSNWQVSNIFLTTMAKEGFTDEPVCVSLVDRCMEMIIFLVGQ
jgi:hypothetical protein